MNKTLDDLRQEIDAADEEILTALAKRIQTVREIGRLKKEQKIKPLDEERWQHVRQKLSEKTKALNLPEDLIQKIYEEIHQSALKIEHE